MNKLFALAIGLLALLGSANAATVAFDPPTKTAKAGDVFKLQLGGSSFTTATLGGLLNLNFDPAVLAIQSVKVDDGWDFDARPGTINNTAGSLTQLSFASSAGKRGAFAIASIEFKALAAGFSSLTLSKAGPFGDETGNEIEVELKNASVNVSPAAVPVPAAIWSLLGGLGWIVGGARRKAV